MVSEIFQEATALQNRKERLMRAIKKEKSKIYKFRAIAKAAGMQRFRCEKAVQKARQSLNLIKNKRVALEQRLRKLKPKADKFRAMFN
jgi:hypothetical protein